MDPGRVRLQVRTAGVSALVLVLRLSWNEPASRVS